MEKIVGLGKWAVIDIETTGISSLEDSIIDIGFLEFEGTKLARKFNSLVQYDGELSYFIQKLTGIKKKMLRQAPTLKSLLPDIEELFGYNLVAHNADFERSFLRPFFDKIDDGSTREQFQDSLYFLALLFPEKSSLNLESFIIDFNIAEKEQHRAYSDAIDLLKVMLTAVGVVMKRPVQYATLRSQFIAYGLAQEWFFSFLTMGEDALYQIADAIDYNLTESVEHFLEKERNLQNSKNVHLATGSVDKAFSGENIKKILQDSDNISQTLPGYKFRQAQVDFALRVGQSFKNKVHAIIQAPTGTGKTLGYLLPAMLFSKSEKKQVLVVTGTKTLQRQAQTKDVPAALDILQIKEREFRSSFLIGASNHLCELAFRQQQNDGDMLKATRPFEERFTDLYFEMVFFYNQHAGDDNFIAVDDLPYLFKKKILPFKKRTDELAVDYRTCAGKNCVYRQACSYLNGLINAQDADLIISNHAMMFSWPKSLPMPEYVVVDEAHKLEKETTSAFMIDVTSEKFHQLLESITHNYGIGSLYYLIANSKEFQDDATAIIEKIRNSLADLAPMIKGGVEELTESVELYFKKLPKYTELYWNEVPMFTKESSNDNLSVAILGQLDRLQSYLKGVEFIFSPYSSQFQFENFDSDEKKMAYAKFEVFIEQVHDLMVGLEHGLNAKEGYCNSLKYHQEFGVALESAPINVGKIISEQVLARSAAAVFTSATLGNVDGTSGGKGIEWATGYLYADPAKRFKTGLFLPPVFDYKNRTKIFLCDDVPSIHDNSFVSKTLKEAIEIINALEGRSLILFSSKARFEVAREILIGEFEGKIPIFIQGMGNNVVDDFKKAPMGVLLGMEVFGEGIDIPGMALQFVFVDKIPDLRMDHVINVRREFYEREIGNEFVDYYLSGRTRSLQQKLGRLLRTESDLGAAMIVDSRAKNWKGRTMEQFISLMRPYHIQRKNIKTSVRFVKKN